MDDATALVKMLSGDRDGSSWEIVDRSDHTSAETIPAHHLNDSWTLRFDSRPGDCILLRRTYADEVTYELLRHRVLTEHGNEHKLVEDFGVFMEGRRFTEHDGRLRFTDTEAKYWLEPGWWGYCQCITEKWSWHLFINRLISEFMGPSTSHGFRNMLEKAPFGDVMSYLSCFNEFRNFEETAKAIPQIVAALNQELAPLLEKNDGQPLCEMMTDRGVIRGVGNRIGWRLSKFWDACDKLMPGSLKQIRNPLEFTEPR